MSKGVKSLQEVSKEINEEIGTFKNFSANNGYFKATMRNGRDINLIASKVRANLSFRGTNQPISFGYFKSKKGYNSKYKNNKEFANQYGEYIAYIILKQLGKKACRVDLGIMPMRNPYSKKDIEIEGILSHFQLSQEEIFKPINLVIEDYMQAHPKKYRQLTERGKTDSESNYTNIVVILEAIADFLNQNAQKDKLPQIRKKFFDMCIFDLKFANRDRHDENFGLRINQATDQIEFYHLFDNEQILGMQENKTDIIKYLSSNDEYQKFSKRELTSCVGIPNQTQKISSKIFLKYLLENYYEETMDSLEDIGRYSFEDLEELLECFQGLSLEHKEFAKKIFLERQREIESVVQEFQQNKEDKVEEEPDL